MQSNSRNHKYKLSMAGTLTEWPLLLNEFNINLMHFNKLTAEKVDSTVAKTRTNTDEHFQKPAMNWISCLTPQDETALFWSFPIFWQAVIYPKYFSFLLTHTLSHTHIHTVCPRFSGRSLGPAVQLGWSLWSAATVERSQPGTDTLASSISCSQSAPLGSICLPQSQAPWTGHGWTGHTPPPRSSSRHTWGRHSASAAGHSSSWADGSQSPARWWRRRCVAAGCSLLPSHCWLPTLTEGDKTWFKVMCQSTPTLTDVSAIK